MAEAARRKGIPSQFSPDLSTCDDEGTQWDLGNPEMQKKAVELLGELKPELLTLSPPCIMFSTPGAGVGVYVTVNLLSEVRRGASRFHANYTRSQAKWHHFNTW